MDIGIKCTATNNGTLDDVIEDARAAADHGLASLWVPNYFGMDALTCLAIVGREVPALRLGTSIVPIYTRHPFAMAQQALTVQAVVGGRLTLGIGLSHQPIVEGAWQLQFVRPVATMRDYLRSLSQLTQPGEHETGRPTSVPDEPTAPKVPGAGALPIVVAALGPKMVELAGTCADGVVLWCMGAHAVAAMLGPLSVAAAAASRPEPRIIAALPVCVTRDETGSRERLARRYASVDAQASYRRALGREGVSSVADVALVGSEQEVLDGLHRLEGAGVTEFTAMVSASNDGERTATLDALATAATVGDDFDSRRT